jgi:hypothetical protein
MKSLIFTLIASLILVSCTEENEKLILWGISPTIEHSKKLGVFMWEYEPDRDTLYLRGQKVPLKIIEAFAELDYRHPRDRYSEEFIKDSVVIQDRCSIVISFADTFPRFDSIEPLCIGITPLRPKDCYYKKRIVHHIRGRRGVLPPDTFYCPVRIKYHYYDSEGHNYRDKMGRDYYRIDTLDAFYLIRKRSAENATIDDRAFLKRLHKKRNGVWYYEQ